MSYKTPIIDPYKHHYIHVADGGHCTFAFGSRGVESVVAIYADARCVAVTAAVMQVDIGTEYVFPFLDKVFGIIVDTCLWIGLSITYGWKYEII